jgi:TRAP-type C4-dicarboxylate transport system permease small subunit
MNKLLKVYDYMLDKILAICFFVMALIVFGQIITRYFFGFTLIFIEEISRYLFVWIIYLGGARAFILKRHLIVDIFVNKIKKPYKIYIDITLYISIILFLFFVFLNGIKYAGIYWNSPFDSTDYLKLGWAYLVIPLGSILMILNIIRVILEVILINMKG